MSGRSKIEWTDATWNPVRGCSIVSKGCTNCYAMKQAHRFAGAGQAYEGLTKMTRGGPVWTGKVHLVRELLDQPLRWKKPRRIFVNSMSDLFHENVSWEFIDAVFGVMAVTTRHTYQILTKRPKRMFEYMQRQKLDPLFGFPERISHRAAEFLRKGADNCGPAWPLKNVWLGVSAEDQPTVDERVHLLMQTPAAVRWISAEPLLGRVFVSPWLYKACRTDHVGIDWVVAGGESGPKARPSHPDWFRSLRDQCAAAGVPFFFKQWGEWWEVDEGQNIEIVDADDYYAAELFEAGDSALVSIDGRTFTRETLPPDTPGRLMTRLGKRAAGRLLDGREHSEYPA